MYEDLKDNKKMNNNPMRFITTRLHYTNLTSVYTKILELKQLIWHIFFWTLSHITFSLKKSTLLPILHLTVH